MCSLEAPTTTKKKANAASTTIFDGQWDASFQVFGAAEQKEVFVFISGTRKGRGIAARLIKFCLAQCRAEWI